MQSLMIITENVSFTPKLIFIRFGFAYFFAYLNFRAKYKYSKLRLFESFSNVRNLKFLLNSTKIIWESWLCNVAQLEREKTPNISAVKSVSKIISSFSCNGIFAPCKRGTTLVAALQHCYSMTNWVKKSRWHFLNNIG